MENDWLSEARDPDRLEAITFDMESWERALSATDVVGLVYSFQEDTWYFDCRATDGRGEATRTFGSLGLLVEGNGLERIYVPRDVLLHFDILRQAEQRISPPTWQGH